MKQQNFRMSSVLPVIVVGVCLLAPAPMAAQDGCSSGDCHAKLLKGRTLHPIAETCESCHESVTTPHPQKGAKTFKLTQEPPELCYTCHDRFGKKSHVHSPVEGGMCTMCHNPHSSDEAKLLEQPQKDMCKGCHADHLEFKVLHGPVSAGDCTACHSPHESDKDKLLVRSGEELCVGCHLDMPEVLKKKVVHPALLSGCTSCHNPHGSAYPKMLPEEGEKLCFSCHSEIAGKVEKSAVVHAAVMSDKGCANCHSPHAGDNPGMLLSAQKDLCLGCHPTILAKTMTMFHGPINEGKCTGCHNPHGAPFPKLLAKPGLPEAPYVPYTDTEYALCFSCHNRDLLRYPDTAFATNFRDGDRNLHYLHVNNKQKGRSCRMCHNVHGSPNPKLIPDTVQFGKWNLPLKFVKTDTGGGCTPGCHRLLYYDRKEPGKRPDLPKPTPRGR